MNFFSKVKILSIALILLLMNSCHYQPFIGYLVNKKGFKKFSKKEQLAGDNSNPQRAYKVNRYDWDLEVFPEKKEIAGSMDIHFTSLSEQAVFLFDLQKKMEIYSYESSFGKPILTRKHDFVYLTFKEPVKPGTRIKLSINYGGKPANLLKEGPIQWKKDEKGRDWISSITEGIGPQFIMPCNALLGNEADSSTLNITAPNDLTVVSNGRLVEVVENTSNATRTFKHSINNPINTYSLSFNIGHLTKITKPYVDLNGTTRQIEFHVLDYNEKVADKFYDQTLRILKEFELMFGEYPFWNDGCKFIESTFSAMEHQSGIAMGSEYHMDVKDYNSTLIHELSHEWWGNSVTGKDYCDIWLHEGMATYSEALFLEKVYGKALYELKLQYDIRMISNTIPILKKCGVLYNSWLTNADQDIYNKGSMMMHSLRIVVDNDSVFLTSLQTLQTYFSKQNVSTDEFLLKLYELLGQDYSSLFDWYLNEPKPPTLEVRKKDKEGKLYYKWNKEIPFYKNGEIWVAINGTLRSLIPSSEEQFFEYQKGDKVRFFSEKSIYYIVDSK